METHALIGLLGANPSASLPAQDTVFAVSQISTLQLMSEYADLAVAIGLLFILLFMLLLARKAYRLAAEIEDVLKGYRKDLAPVFDRTRVVAENVEYVSRVVRGDVERLQTSVDALGRKLSAATHEMEDRIQEFNVLLGVVQDEAEDLFLDTAATVKGVKTGAQELASGRRPGPAAGERIPAPADPPASED